jgi:hypothetical protein
MVGGLAIVGEGWGKIRFDNEFQPFWKLFAFSMVSITVGVILTHFGTPMVENFVLDNLGYAFGATCFFIGTFFLWFVHAGDFDIATDFKWVFPVICYTIFVLNIIILNYEAIVGITHQS